LGTCSVSPLVLASYHRNRTLNALAPATRLCLAFGFCMSFFGLATMLILFGMALERCLALGQPYFYERFLSPRAAFVALPATYSFAAAFCSLPLLGFGHYVQYCPGTWCFIEMHSSHLRRDGKDVAFSLLYATLLLLLIVAVLLCNLSVIANLVRMHRRGQRTRRPAALGKFSMAEEVDHLLLLSIMTITFVICSLPFTIRAYINQVEVAEGDHEWDLLALRFLSINSIVDPWVFAILRPPLLRLARSVLCCQAAPAPRDSAEGPGTAKGQQVPRLGPGGR
ncbi:PE2R2 protein, partial [Nothoprocta ornata]|nr:PE2R2 protein [Nothoprocta ornata]